MSNCAIFIEEGHQIGDKIWDSWQMLVGVNEQWQMLVEVNEQWQMLVEVNEQWQLPAPEELKEVGE